MTRTEVKVEQLRLGRGLKRKKETVEDKLSRDDLVWDLAEELALEKFYIRQDGRLAKKPAFLVFHEFLGAKWALVMCGVGAVWRLRSKSAVYELLGR
jgi:hypothetical protein